MEVEIEGIPDVDAEFGIDDVAETVLWSDFAQVSDCKFRPIGWMEKHGDWKHVQVILNWTSDKS